MGTDVASRSGKVFIATGAGAGIGLEIVKGLLANPNSSLVIGVDIQTSELDKLLPEHHNRLAVIQGDVSDRSTNQRAIEIAIDRAGKLDCIILNAGILRPVGLAAVTEVTDWKKLFDVNFFGVVHAIQLALPHLRATNGQVLMTSSGVSLQPYASWIPYACSKAAMNCLCACLPMEEDQVAFLCVTPGIVDTGMQAQVRGEHKANMPAEQHNWLTSLYSKGGLLRAEQPASSFVKLALNGIPKSLNGKVIPWDDVKLDTKG